MSDHGVLIDTSTRTIMLREPKGGNVFLVPLSLLGSSLVVTPILGCNMTILVVIQISCIYIWSLTSGCIWNGAIGSCIVLDVVLHMVFLQ